jgi:formylglycine-generating enzyme required for sulfatase activity
LNQQFPLDKWCWSLPTEDMWEYAARTEAGLTYPWGDAFDAGKCNSTEAALAGTSAVEQFLSGASREGCRDMAGNVWEFMAATHAGNSLCVLRGGSFKNDRFTTRSYLRLLGVPTQHRPADFGFRVVQQDSTTLEGKG